VKWGYEWKRVYGRGDYHSTWICWRELELGSWGKGSVQGAPVCWRFWAQGLGYPYGILELGSCPSWQDGNTVLGSV
jgi:hypothetical protein